MMLLTPLVTIITALIGWFDSKEKAVLLVLVMLVLFMAALIWIVWRHIANARSLRAATAAIRDALARSDWTTADRLNAADAALAQNAVAGAA